MCHDTSCSNCNAVSDVYAGQDNASTANPHILADIYRCGERFPEITVFTQAFLWHGGMESCVDMHSRAYTGIIAMVIVLQSKKTQFMVIFTFLPMCMFSP